MAKTYNAIDMKGRLYNYKLEIIQTEKGEAISGEVELEVDENGTRVSARFFGYPTYNSGKPNKTYVILDDMLAGDYKTVVDNGEDADWLGMSGSIEVGYFVAKNANTDDGIVRSQKIRGNFINPNGKKEYSNKWKLDMIITEVIDVDANEERQLPRYVKTNGYFVDDYNERVMWVEFQARSEAAMNYIIGLDPSIETPYYVPVWGSISSIKRVVITESAFGDPKIEEYNNTAWEITGMQTSPYDWNDEATMTDEQFEEYRAALAEFKEAQKKKAEAANGESDDDLPF